MFEELLMECGKIKASDRMKMRAVYNLGEYNGFVYTYGLAECHPSKTEFICFNCPRELVISVHDMFSFLADRLTSGVTVCANQTCESRGIYYRSSSFSDADNASLLKTHACACCEHDIKLLRLMPVGTVDDMPVLVPAIATSTNGGAWWSLNDPQGVLFTDSAPTVADIFRNCNLTYNEFMSSELMEQ